MDGQPGGNRDGNLSGAITLLRLSPFSRRSHRSVTTISKADITSGSSREEHAPAGID
jgi:hypothetical protein